MQPRFSHDIKSLLERLANQPLTLGDILSETCERGFCLVIALFVLPFLFPMPPGLTGPLGSVCLLLAIQMTLGRRSPWLPKKIARFQFPHWFVLRLLQNLKRVTRVLEKIARPRLQRLANSHITWRLNGVCIAWLTLLLISPVPFTNPIPTVGILLLAVATLEADGLLMCIGYVVTVLITLFFGFICYALWQAPSLIPNLNSFING